MTDMFDDHAPAMTDPLVHAILTSPETRQAARDIVDGIVASLPAHMSLYALLTALTSTFVGMCDDHDIDPEAAFAQIAHTVHRDDATFDERGALASAAAVSDR